MPPPPATPYAAGITQGLRTSLCELHVRGCGRLTRAGVSGLSALTCLTHLDLLSNVGLSLGPGLLADVLGTQVELWLAGSGQGGGWCVVARLGGVAGWQGGGRACWACGWVRGWVG